tara:strand:- start:123 stop:398 length:276 start_codon:yes stop_codon:yes gene_type:complete
MINRLLPIGLIALLLIIQAQLWFGRGSLPKVSKLKTDLEAQNFLNSQSLLVNEQLKAEINDLRNGLNIVEGKARQDLDMVKPNEILVKISK